MIKPRTKATAIKLREISARHVGRLVTVKVRTTRPLVSRVTSSLPFDSLHCIGA